MPGQYGGEKANPLVKQDIWRQPVWGTFYRPSKIAGGVQVMYPDSGSGTVTLSGSATEAISHSASAAGAATLSGTFTEVHGWTDAGAGTVTLSGARSESETHSRSGNGAVSLATGALQEFNTSSGFSDSPAPSIEFTLSGSGTQSALHSSSAAGTITLTGSRSEAATQAGSRAGTLTLSGSVSEFQAFTYTDSRTGTLTVSYFDGRAYPGDFFPGQVYPGQTIASTLTRDTNTRSGAGTLTLTGSGAESYQNGSSIVHTDSGIAAFTLSGSAAENFGSLDTGAGTITFIGTGHDTGLQPTAVNAPSLTGQASSGRRLVAADVPPRDLVEVPAAPAILTPA